MRDKYAYLGHFRSAKVLAAGHNTGGELPEPLATQEAVGFSKPKPRRVEDVDARRDLKRVKNPAARELRRFSKEADIHDYDRMQDWMSRNPDGTVEDWTRLEVSKGR